MEPYVSSWATNGKFTVTAVDDVVDEEAKTRSLKLSIYHPGLIWTSECFLKTFKNTISSCADYYLII